MNDAMALAQEGATRTLARFAAGLRWADVDPVARHAARRHLIDTLGAMVAGAPQEVTSIVGSVLGAVHGAGDVPVPGLPVPRDVLTAAYLGGTSGHGLELDDGFRPGSVHPGVVVVPAALSLAASRGRSGEALLTAVVAGYEAACRVAASVHPRSRRRGFHNTGIAGVFGAAAAAGSLLGLDAGRMETAFGIAASSAAGLFAFLAGGDVKRIHPGHAAREGLLATLLAEAGLTAPPGVLEGEDGFFQAFGGGGEAALMGAGGRAEASPLAVANCYMKPYACCRHIHSAIDGVLGIMASEGLSAGQVARVEIGTYALAESHAAVGWSEMTTAQMSFPFVIAVALVRGRVTLHEFGTAERTDARILQHTGKVSVHVDAGCEADYPRLGPARTKLTTTDGRVFEVYWPEPSGAAARPLSDAAVGEKFTTLAWPVLGEARAAAALARLWRVENEPDAGGIAASLQAATV